MKGGARLIKEHPWFKGFDWSVARGPLWVPGCCLVARVLLVLRLVMSTRLARAACFSPSGSDHCPLIRLIAAASQGGLRAARAVGAHRHAGQEQRGPVQLRRVPRCDSAPPRRIFASLSPLFCPRHGLSARYWDLTWLFAVRVHAEDDNGIEDYTGDPKNPDWEKDF